MKIVSAVILFIWLILGLFLGIGGITKLNSDESIEIISKHKAELINQPMDIKTAKGVHITNLFDFEIEMEREGVEAYFKWTVELPKFTALIITAMAFGLLGSIISVIKDIVINSKTTAESNYISKPFLGTLTGLVVLGISYILPTILTKGTNEIRPFTLMFICLFCGIYMDKFYERLEISFNKLITRK